MNYRTAEPAKRAAAAELREASRAARERKADDVKARRELKDSEKLRRSNLTKDELKAKRAPSKAA